MNGKIAAVQSEIKKVISGKDEIINTVLTAIFAGGHILLEDVPGVGKTTLALAVSRVLGLKFARVQFTPDVVPSDITGFSIYNNKTGEFTYKEGAILTNFFLADEINRTSSKTQSALLQVMQEGKVTVDGATHAAPEPFIVMATQNPIGTAGTQMLPEAQLDRFMVKISMGYPDFDSQVDILKNREHSDPMDKIGQVLCAEDVIKIKKVVENIYVDEKIYRYITAISEATRNHQFVRLGVSPRAALALTYMAKANAYMQGSDFVSPENVIEILKDTFRHRLMLLPKAGAAGYNEDMILDEIAKEIKAPKTE